MGATAAIYHHPDMIESDNRPLAGRRTAGQSFLAGYARHVDADVIHCAADGPRVIDQFRSLMSDYGWSGEITGVLTSQPRKLATPGTLMVPGPSLGKFAWVRRRAGQNLYSICGITHTVSTRRIMEGLLDMMSSPVEEWDAVICTSKAVQSVVAHELDVAATYLTRRFAARRVPMPQLPVIPLGTDTARFAHDPAARVDWRQKYGLADDDISIMTMGRLSVFEKMHPAPLFLALQRAAMATGRKLHLLMVGWFGDENTEKLHREAAAELSPDVDVIFPDGKDPDLRYSIWSAADIFALPVDNIQETFGLAPIEAMAAGLPVVCSDWNGFKDTVVDGETGYRVRTLMSAPGMGTESAHRFEDGMDNYFQYLGLLHQRTQVDVRELASAFVALINDPEKRARMGKAAAERAQAMYDWAAIIPQYQALWSDLTARRLRGQPSSPRETGEPASPASIDPFVLYQKYPTDRLPLTAILSVEKAVTTDDVARMVRLTGAEQLKRMVAGANQIATVCETINTDGPIRLDTLIQKTKLRQDLVMACVLWMAKFDLVQIRV